MAKQASGKRKSKKSKKEEKHDELCPAAQVLEDAYEDLDFYQQTGVVAASSLAAVISAPIHTVRRAGMLAIDTAKLMASHTLGVAEDISGTYKHTRGHSTLYFSPDAKKEFSDAALGTPTETLMDETGYTLEEVSELSASLSRKKMKKQVIQIQRDASEALRDAQSQDVEATVLA